ncbi:lyase family protein [Catenuloplanes atrovinosus]|uniref:3-carboxy-cis,cis-muconate cycloisomerase n=1 Tax=Catenuloplanes atrovinosus TaxID=137266 RepID=A0AAE4C8E8_9ACTN|nr:lyase family protein [Catenuloplanes atrovinosus]MDR7273719.1 3-carboxy-cis,cis-muconate cycloisomerase [Catenuloplanes atrovinosus]
MHGLVDDTAWLQAMLDAEAALARAQARLGLASPEAAAAITDACHASRFDPAALARDASSAGNPVVPLVRALRAQLPPDVARVAHAGATSQDILDTAAMLIAHRAAGPLLADLTAAADHAAALAAAHRDTPIAGRTLLQQALPTTFGLIAAGWTTALDASATRLAFTRRHALAAQLGGAVGTLAASVSPSPSSASAFSPAGAPTAGSPSPITSAPAADAPSPSASASVSASPPTSAPAAGDGAGAGGHGRGGSGGGRGWIGPALMGAFAEEVGLAEPVLPWHTDRGRVAELAGVLAGAAGTIAKIARDVTLLAQTEVGEVREGGERGGSSTMPHKSNPIAAISAAASAARAPGLAATLFAAMAHEHQRAAGSWHAEWLPLTDLLRAVGSAAHWLRDCLAHLEIGPARMRANLDLTGGVLLAERLAAALAPALGKDAAHDLIADVVRDGRPLTGDPRVTAHLDPATVAALLDPADYLGSAGTLVDRALAARPEAPMARDSGMLPRE